MTVQPLFLFSLPRTGSTLAQRILASHAAVTTASEPWILLPYLYTLRERGSYAEYGHSTMVAAVQDFCQELPQGADDYLSEMRHFILRLYAKAAQPDATYFLDKTPRYHLIVEDVIRLFPEGKFIFLWRNPLAIVASIMETWAHGNWNLYAFEVDLFQGLSNLAAAYRRHAGEACAVRYEDLVANPESEWQRVFAYLDLPFDSDLLSKFTEVRLNGRMGDHTGTMMYQRVSEDPLDKWRQTLVNPLRRSWCRRYLRWIGQQRLELMGYDLDQLLHDLDSTPSSTRFLASDLLRNAYGLVQGALKSRVMKRTPPAHSAWRQTREQT